MKSTGYGNIKIGNMQLKGVVHVPTFSHNLLSGIQVMRAGYKQVIKDDRITIYDKNNQIIATGEYDPNYGLLRMHEGVEPACNISSLLSLMDWHSKLGHLSESLLRRTLKSYNIDYKGNKLL